MTKNIRIKQFGIELSVNEYSEKDDTLMAVYLRVSIAGNTLTQLEKEWIIRDNTISSAKDVQEFKSISPNGTYLRTKIVIDENGGEFKTDNSGDAWFNINKNIGITLFHGNYNSVMVSIGRLIIFKKKGEVKFIPFIKK